MKEQNVSCFSQARWVAVVVSFLWFATSSVQAEVAGVVFKTSRNVKYF